jgi:hypothetical protein
MNVIFLGLTPCEENLTNDPGAVCPVLMWRVFGADTWKGNAEGFLMITE